MVCAAEIAFRLARPLFVVAPLSTLPAWHRELGERQVSPLEIINYEKLRGGRTRWVKPDRYSYIWDLPKNAIVCFDEAQRLKSAKSITSKMAVAAKPFTTLLASGSIAENPLHLRAAGYLGCLFQLKFYWQWAKERGCIDGFFGPEFTQIEERRDRFLDQLHHEIIPDHGSQIDAAAMAPYMPNNNVLFEQVDFGDKDKIKKIYSEMEDELRKLAERESLDSTQAEVLTAQLRARQKAELLKIPLLAERAQDLLAEGNRVVVFLTFNDSLQALSERLNGIPIISGIHKNRQEVIDKFQADEIPILGVNTAAGGVGIGLHGKKPRATLLTPSFNPIDILQATYRTPRVGGGDVVQHILTAAGTIELEVERELKRKLRNIEIVNEGISTYEKKIVDQPINTPEVVSTVSDEDNSWVDGQPAHAEYAPSSLGMMERCPGWRNRDEQTEASLRGTRIHKAIENGTITELVEEEQPVAQKCVEFMDAIIAESRPALPDVDIKEIRTNMDLNGGINTFGTADRLLIYGNRGIAFDYKSGWRAVTDAEFNAQGWCYTIGVFQKYPQIEELTFWFLIPNRDQASSHTFTRSDLPRMILRLNTVIRRAMEIEPAFLPGADFSRLSPQPELCEYCARQGECPAVMSKSILAAAMMRPELRVPNSILVDKNHPQDIADLLRLAPIMEKCAETIRKRAIQLNLEEGLEIPGFKRIERSTPRTITSVLGAWQVVEAKYPKTDLADFLAACSKISMPQLEELIASFAPKNGKAKAKVALEDALRHADLIHQEGSIHYLKEAKL